MYTIIYYHKLHVIYICICMYVFRYIYMCVGVYWSYHAFTRMRTSPSIGFTSGLFWTFTMRTPPKPVKVTHLISLTAWLSVPGAAAAVVPLSVASAPFTPAAVVASAFSAILSASSLRQAVNGALTACNAARSPNSAAWLQQRSVSANRWAPKLLCVSVYGTPHLAKSPDH